MNNAVERVDSMAEGELGCEEEDDANTFDGRLQGNITQEDLKGHRGGGGHKVIKKQSSEKIENIRSPQKSRISDRSHHQSTVSKRRNRASSDYQGENGSQPIDDEGHLQDL